MQKTSGPFRASLFGISPRDSLLLPLTLPYIAATDRRLLSSDLSFKCRSSSSLSITILLPTPRPSKPFSLPSCPEKALLGLGIYAPQTSISRTRPRTRTRTSFLNPRSSLSSIRTHTTMASRPSSSSPLPPLPAYFPHDHGNRGSNSTQTPKAFRPPRPPRPYPYDPYSPTASSAKPGLRLVPPSPNRDFSASRPLAVLLKTSGSQESLSSAYSRSTSGESRRASCRAPRPVALGEVGRSWSAGSCGSATTAARSPLGVMRLVGEPEVVVLGARDSRGRAGFSREDVCGREDEEVGGGWRC